MIFHQIRCPAGTYSYLLGDRSSRLGLIVDPVADNLPVLHALLDDLAIDLRQIALTHVHPATVPAALHLRELTGARLVAAGNCDLLVPDRGVEDGECLVLADEVIHVIATPGHTPCSLCFRWRDRLFTGDTLLIGSCGDTGDRHGDAGRLYDSVTEQLFPLPAETLIFPGRDANGRTVSTVAEEKAGNPRFRGRSRDSFVAEAVRHRIDPRLWPERAA